MSKICDKHELDDFANSTMWRRRQRKQKQKQEVDGRGCIKTEK